MNLKRFLGLALFTYLICAAFAVGTVSDTPKPTTPQPFVTVTLTDLTPQQLQDRAEELTTTTSTSTSTTTSTQPATTVVAVPAETHCQEWFPTAIEVGWPNNPAILEKLGQLLWKETRCQNVNYLHPAFNGHDHGLAQINFSAHHIWVEQLFDMPFEKAMADPTINLRFAFLLYNSLAEKGACGFRPWSLC
ncbi:hypothetical protein UFOVP1506_11 [uncultured Caudovirales phage]|uniref:Uncharacterized protein n=1 Tax=uncultured Caudovirales phage TaxID=2100421 RepID=A0A6J5S5I9_9CAUD|nr:hypothetical protein UFOVP292_11 [uncultured Caudovirales phage]CAB4149503.1 hypothetical protein UFOVP559_17 [uncultured Caudovirales phage]CAB4168326.1 hypothetical protein UFOVP880_12 [uncultured Caudovirales phage]CAB4180174.1 hypothetical protein UFOVP1055_10 [uncultured Caudovirales phage]CAB4194906.1 hypothetical protein UFOVP1270_10 [uncultured Caudovirales phage]